MEGSGVRLIFLVGEYKDECPTLSQSGYLKVISSNKLLYIEIYITLTSIKVSYIVINSNCRSKHQITNRDGPHLLTSPSIKMLYQYMMKSATKIHTKQSEPTELRHTKQLSFTQ